ncbi:nodulation protein NfeD [Tunturiibacter empetritectus]|uniref:Membrane-bound serine protease (ClpP class) n=1 Tax=Tunturiibacter lichenicola TaxID=2051959 RepID=A0A852VGS6_9BACT|nr:nodulation protein NfeD [Edaphobacter lichenicola]NYF88666.1 membrane-bound serine protease (ClpP class) [Edaphobacter lichenicola]
MTSYARVALLLLMATLCARPTLIFAAPVASGTVVKLTIHDTIQPITADYLQRGLREAASQHAEAVLISLGTPGGLLESTRVMVQAIENSPVPVIIFISPTGSRAGSAGFFLLESADIAVMAPGTNAGAAHPIVEGRQLDPILKEKIENDAAAFLRSYTSRRGRNVAAAEDAVRNSKSYSDEEALNLKLIDLVSADDASLLKALDGRAIHRFDGTTQTLHLQGAQIITTAPSQRERLLSKLTNPDVAVLLLILGALLIYLEFNVPGTVVPGSIGTLFVLLGLFGLNLLPIRHTAIVLLLAALVMMVLEAKFSSHGVLAAVGIAALIFGLATLVDGPIPELRVHLATALGAGLGFGTISFGLAWIALRARRGKVLTGPQAMIGGTAVVRTPLCPTGQVEIRGELWQASLQGQDSLSVGSLVSVRGFDGLTLVVEPANKPV